MNKEIELRHLRYFLAVAETLHFSKAARLLGMAQPPLSQQIKRLEQLVGHSLFDRTTRGVKLTLAGQLLAERARSTIEKVQDDLAQVRRLGRGEEGTLTVGFSGSVMFTDLPLAIESRSGLPAGRGPNRRDPDRNVARRALRCGTAGCPSTGSQAL